MKHLLFDLYLQLSEQPFEVWVEWGIQGLIVITGIAGQLYIIKKNGAGFWFWVVSNSTAFGVSIYKSYYGMAILYGFYCVMCFYGMKTWRKDANKDEKI